MATTRRYFLHRTAVIAATVVAAFKAPLVLARELGAQLSQVRGRVVLRGDADYTQWWNAMSWYLYKPQRYPDAIVRAKSTEDIKAALAHARAGGLKVVVRSGGHNPAKSVLREGGLLLDLSRLRQVEINARAKTAWVDPGIHGEVLVKKLAAQGLDFPAAHTGIVPIGGYLLGGGLGWDMPERDLACRSILAAEVITADGRELMASATENRDLWWAIRGCGPGFFGVVRRYQLQLFPLHQHIVKSKYLFPIDTLGEVCTKLEKVVAAKDVRLEILAVVGRFYPPEKPPEQRDLVCAVSVFAFADSEADAGALLAPWTQTGLAEHSLLKQENRHMDYEQLFLGQETDYSSANRTAVENIWTDDISKGLQALAQKLLDDPPPSPRCFALSGWGFSNTREDDTSCVSTPAPHYLSWYLMAEEEGDIAPNRRWMDEAVAALKPVSRGHYINEIDPLHYPQHLRECFSPKSWKRLAQLRKRYDPQGVFHSWLGQGDVT